MLSASSTRKRKSSSLYDPIMSFINKVFTSLNIIFHRRRRLIRVANANYRTLVSDSIYAFPVLYIAVILHNSSVNFHSQWMLY